MTDSKDGIVTLNDSKKPKNEKVIELTASINDSVFQEEVKTILEDFLVVDSENI